MEIIMLLTRWLAPFNVLVCVFFVLDKLFETIEYAKADNRKGFHYNLIRGMGGAAVFTIISLWSGSVYTSIFVFQSMFLIHSIVFRIVTGDDYYLLGEAMERVLLKVLEFYNNARNKK